MELHLCMPPSPRHLSMLHVTNTEAIMARGRLTKCKDKAPPKKKKSGKSTPPKVIIQKYKDRLKQSDEWAECCLRHSGVRTLQYLRERDKREERNVEIALLKSQIRFLRVPQAYQGRLIWDLRSAISTSRSSRLSRSRRYCKLFPSF